MNSYENPLRDPQDRRLPRIAGPCVLVIFGVTGDLSRKKLMPAVYDLANRGLLPPGFGLVGFARRDWADQDFAQVVHDAVKEHARTPFREEVWQQLLEGIRFVSGTFDSDESFEALKRTIDELDTTRGTGGNHAFYLSIPPSGFEPVMSQLANHGLAERHPGTWNRVVIEKPFGHDLASAKALNDDLHQFISEEQLFRIDHFLGKMPVEDILYLRFGNQILEPIWNNKYIKSVQITMAENFGVADRGSFYDPVGTLRDVVQNHLMQVLSMVAMEPPAGIGTDIINDRKRDVFLAMPPADPAHYVRGQYDGYLGVTGVAPDSTTETYCALKLHVENWRWHGVPFFIRAGKALPVRDTEVRVVFHRPPPLPIAASRSVHPAANELVLRIDPNPGACLELVGKAAESHNYRNIHMDMDFASEGGDGPTPYEELLSAAMAGVKDNFADQSAVEETWRVVQPLLDSPPPVIRYAQGTWGPAEADQLTKAYGGWREPWLAG